MKANYYYFGEQLCNVKGCKHKAYYYDNKCGRHVLDKTNKKALPKNPKKKESDKLFVDARIESAVPTKNPQITATKIRMMQKPVPKEGYLLVCPNNKHGHNYGYPGDYSSLSPMKLGPTISNKVAKNIENYHQFGKVFPQETSNEPCKCGRPFVHNKPLPEWYITRDNGYNDPEPHRHKFPKERKNIPSHSIQDDRCYTYVESRYFYCKQMELLAIPKIAFQELVRLYQEGYSLDIHGYDAYEPKGTDKDSLYAHYCDSSKPFGHEMVILSMLSIENVADFPWNVYKNKYIEIYTK